MRTKQAHYALNHLSQIPRNPFFSHGNESDERGTCAALTLLLGSFKPISGQPDATLHISRETQEHHLLLKVALGAVSSRIGAENYY